MVQQTQLMKYSTFLVSPQLVFCLQNEHVLIKFVVNTVLTMHEYYVIHCLYKGILKLLLF